MKTSNIGVFAILLTAASTLAAHPTSAAATTGEAAPSFTLSDTSGDSHSLSDFKGKYVVLEWVNHECPFVKKHYESDNMQKLQKAYSDKGVAWLSICSSAPGKQGNYPGPEAAKLTADKGAAPTAYLFDEDGTVGRMYGAKVTPHMFIIDPDGTLIYQGAIDDTPSTKAADIEGAKNYVSAVLDAAMAGAPVERSSTQAYGCRVKYLK